MASALGPARALHPRAHSHVSAHLPAMLDGRASSLVTRPCRFDSGRGLRAFRSHWSYTHGDAGSIPADPASGCRLMERRPTLDGKTNGHCTRTARFFPPARAGAASQRARAPRATLLRSSVTDRPYTHNAFARLHLAETQNTATAARLGRAPALEKRDGRDPVLYPGSTGSIPAEGSSSLAADALHAMRDCGFDSR
jgi:hypothetical protein